MSALARAPRPARPRGAALPRPRAPRRRLPRRSLAALGLLGVWIAALALARAAGHNPAPLMRDPATMAGMPVWHGALSIVGCMGWAAAAALCFANRLAHVDPDRATWGLLASLTAALGIDDALMLHEEVLPALGVAEPATFAAYGLAVVAIARRLRVGAGYDLALLAVAAGALALSVAVDVVDPGPVIYEDGPKLFGIAALCWWSAGRVAAQVGARGWTTRVQAGVGGLPLPARTAEAP